MMIHPIVGATMVEMQQHHARLEQGRPDDWMDQHGIDNVEATMEEMQQHHARLEQEAAFEEDTALPWTHVEELVAGHHELGPAEHGSWTPAALRCVMAVAALASFAVPLLRVSTFVVSCSSESKSE